MSSNITIDYKAGTLAPQWCPGCGDFTALAAFYQALRELTNQELLEKYSWDGWKTAPPLTLPDDYCQKTFIGVAPHTLVTDGGIGCMGQFPQYVNTYSIKLTHGRLLTFALGLNAMRPDLTIFGVGGDGDAFAIGGCHMINFPTWGMNITYLVANNRVYGLTKGQTAPGAHKGMKTKTTPYGAPKEQMNFMKVAIASGWTFVARIAACGKLKDGFDTRKQAVEIIKKAMVHPGSSLIIDETECPTYNKEVTPEYLREHVIPVETLRIDDPTMETHEKHRAYNPTIAYEAFRLAEIEEGEEGKIPIGIYYHVERETFHERFEIQEPLIFKGRNEEECNALIKMFS